VLNTWVVGLVESLAETIGLARALGFEPELFLETIAGGPPDSGYAQLKGRRGGRGVPAELPAPAGAEGRGPRARGRRGTRLELPVIQGALRRLERAQQLGLGDDVSPPLAMVARPGVEQRA
jgi:3-hydroxyisobutyrate dehydrogenase